MASASLVTTLKRLQTNETLFLFLKMFFILFLRDLLKMLFCVFPNVVILFYQESTIIPSMIATVNIHIKIILFYMNFYF